MSATRTDPKLDELLAYWQPRMRLADWSIDVRYKRHMEGSGKTKIWWAYKRAEIDVCDPIDWRNERRAQDVEVTIVHELGHCLAAPFHTENGTTLGDAEEQLVEAYAFALVETRREARKPLTPQL